jgi:hypothetical protein
MRSVWFATCIAACLACSDRVGGRYETFAHAERAGMVSRGWMPAFVPRTATDLWEEHDLDTNELWLRFNVPAGDTSVLSGAVPMPQEDLRRVYRQPPSGLSAMPDELRGHLAPETESGRVAYVRHPPGEHGQYCAALHRQANMAYVWSCER